MSIKDASNMSDDQVPAWVRKARIRNRAYVQQYQPKTGAKCGCRPGIHRDNCPNCEGTGQVIDFAAIRARR